MLLKIRIQNAFVHKDVTFKFEAGHTVISGKNGKGKSLIAEMTQYALWGTSALRGEADDYKKTAVDLWFVLKGKTLHVSRSARAVTLGEVVEAGELAIASGTKPVNAAMQRLFGYSFDVFKIANAANQGAIATLSNMGATARKRMVDETIGLNVIDVLEKFVADSVKADRLVLAAKQPGPEPVAPDKPEGYAPVAELDAVLTKLRMDLRTLEILQSKANAVIPMPVPPTEQTFPHTLEEMREKEEAYQRDQAERTQARQALNKLPKPREEVFLHAEDDKLAQYEEEQAYENQITTARETLVRSIGNTPRSSPYSIEELEAILADHAMVIRWDRKAQLTEAQQLNHCPNCDHEWHTPDPRLLDYEDVPGVRPVPAMAKGAAESALGVARAVRSKADLWTHLDNLVSKWPDRRADISAIESSRKARSLYENSLGYETQREELTTRLAQPELHSYKAEITRAEEYERQKAAYTQALERAQADEREKAIAVEAVSRFPADLPVQVAVLEARVRACLLWDSQAAAYATALELWNRQKAEITALEGQIEEWVAARSAMMDVRAEVKGYLLPSLNKVASSLLNQMTGGELGYFHVNEDFDITVDGIGVDKLSGAGKDVANLALRLGLGTVLTNQTFSVLVLDEIDQGCDKDRAQYISQCLNNLTKTFKQVIVISHKEGLTCDHRIEL